MSNIPAFLKLYKPYRFQVLLSVVLSSVTMLAGIALLAVSGWFITSMAIAGVAGVTMNYFAPAATIRGLSIMRIAGRYAERLITHDCALKVSGAFRGWFFRHLERIAPQGLKDLYSADIFARMRSDTDILEKFYLNSVVPLAASLTALLILFFVLFQFNSVWAVYQAALLLVCGATFPALILYAGRRDQARLQETFQDVRIGLNESCLGLDDVLVYHGSARQERKFIDLSDVLAGLQARIQRRESLMAALVTIGMGFGIVGALYFMTSDPSLQDKGDLGMAPLLALAGFDVVALVPAAFQAFFVARHSADRIFSMAGRCADYLQVSTDVPKGEGFTLEARGLSFSYGSVPILNNVHFSLKAGQVLVVTGRSGAGKSTITQFLSGFITPPSDCLFLNGADMTACVPESVRSFFSVAPQKPYLFTDTIEQNLLIAKPAASAETLDKACRLACLDDVIAAMPDGYKTFIGGNGARLSGGQIRRLSLARAFLKNAPCLVLDEPFEGLEAGLQERILRNICALAREEGRAVLLCLHEMPAGLKEVACEAAL